MIVFAFSKLNSTLALAIKSFAEYFSLPVEIADIRQPRPFGKVLIMVVESSATNSATMREIEKLRNGRERLVLLFSPKAEAEPFASILVEMPNLFFISASASAQDLIKGLRHISNLIETNIKFYIESDAAEEAFLAHRYVDSTNTANRMLASDYLPYIPHMILGRTLFESERIPPALEHAQKALLARPKSIAAASLVAAAHQKLGQSKVAEKYLVEFLPVAETSMLYMIQLGDVYFENGKITDAKAMYQKSKKLDPTEIGALKGLLAVSILDGDWKSAKQMTTSALVHTDLGRFCNLRAISLTANLQFKNAEKLYLNTIKMLGKDRHLYKLYFNLGLCMKKSGDALKSVKYFEMCERMAPKIFSRVTEQLKVIRRNFPRGNISD